MNTQTKITVRWMIRRDLPQIVQIELDSAGGWDEDRVLRHMAVANKIGMVAEADAPGGGTVVVGFVLYELRANCVRINRIAVHPNWRRRGVGRDLVARLKGRLGVHGHRRDALSASVPENAVGAQCFLRQCGFTGKLRDGKVRFSFKKEAAK